MYNVSSEQIDAESKAKAEAEKPIAPTPENLENDQKSKKRQKVGDDEEISGMVQLNKIGYDNDEGLSELAGPSMFDMGGSGKK